MFIVLVTCGRLRLRIYLELWTAIYNRLTHGVRGLY